MPNKILWEDRHIKVDPPKRPKKITGTRFASILGLNRWKTPFGAWAEITRTYEEPFEDNIYTIAGKTIEPKLFEYLKVVYPQNKIITPTDMYGEDYFKKTWGDFFHENKIFGGMWDCLMKTPEGETIVVEIKTTKRAEDWLDGVPTYYDLQVQLYTYLLGATRYVLTASFLDDKDYEDPDSFVVTPDNTMIIEKTLDKKAFEVLLDEATEFWERYVVTGESPEFTKADDSIIKALRTTSLPTNDDIEALLDEAADIMTILESYEDYDKRLKDIESVIRASLENNLTEDMDCVETGTPRIQYSLSRSVRESIDKRKLGEFYPKALEECTKTSEVLTLRKKLAKETR